MSVAFLFPGQGSQKAGMGRELAGAFRSARDVFEEVDEALGRRLSRIIFEGPDEVLTMTENAQPALMAVSMAVVRALREDFGIEPAARAAFLAGHSLGEYSALAAAGAFPPPAAAKLLQLRGRAMQEAVPPGEGAMAAILGLELEAVEKVVEEVSANEYCETADDEICAVANDNAPGQVVVSGHRGAVERAAALAKERGARRAVMLPVSAPFHSPLMHPAAEVMRGALDAARIAPPAVPVVANVTARPQTAPEAIRENLRRQVAGRVRWRESMAWMAQQGVDLFIELGAGRVLTGLVRRCAPQARAMAAGAPEELEALARELTEGS